MPFQIIRNDITKVKADAIVNTANPNVAVGNGTDRAIYYAVGKEQLLAERKKVGIMMPGQVAHTPAFNLSAKYIIHTMCMSNTISGVSATTQQYTDYSSTSSKQAEKKATETSLANSSVVYEKSESASTNKLFDDYYASKEN